MPYVPIVFTLPHALLPLGYRNATRLYTWLLQASAATRREVAANPRHLGAEIGILSILHTWGQTLVRHPHVHGVVPAGGLSADHRRWIRPRSAGFVLPVKLLSRVFRGKWGAARRRAYVRGDLDVEGATERLRDPAQWHTFVDASSRPTGSGTRNQPLVRRQRCCGNRGATLIGSRSAITGCSPSRVTASRFSGRTMPRAISGAR